MQGEVTNYNIKAEGYVVYKLNLVASVCLCVQAPLHMFVDVYVLRIVSKDKILHLINTLIIICLVGLCLSLHYFLHVVHASSNMPWQTFHLLLWSTTTTVILCVGLQCWWNVEAAKTLSLEVNRLTQQ